MGELSDQHEETVAQARRTLLDLGYTGEELDLLVAHQLRRERAAVPRLADAEVAAAVLMVAVVAALRDDHASVRLMIERSRSEGAQLEVAEGDVDPR